MEYTFALLNKSSLLNNKTPNNIFQPLKRPRLPTPWPLPELFTAFLEAAEMDNSPRADVLRPRDRTTSRKNGSGEAAETMFTMDTSMLKNQLNLQLTLPTGGGGPWVPPLQSNEFEVWTLLIWAMW